MLMVFVVLLISQWDAMIDPAGHHVAHATQAHNEFKAILRCFVLIEFGLSRAGERDGIFAKHPTSEPIIGHLTTAQVAQVIH